jgi:S-DNA-T family DNA segregation ATPase FtsK/SpoIIIE
MTEIEMRSALTTKLDALGVRGKIVEARKGPAVTTFIFQPAASMRIRKLRDLSADLSLAMAGSVRVHAPVFGESFVGIEIPNRQQSTVLLTEMLRLPQFQLHGSLLAVPFGLGVYGDPLIVDLADLPHLLVAGTTGAGKSTFLHTLICSIIWRIPWQQVHFLLIDAKAMELSRYNGLPHMLDKVETTAEGAIEALGKIVNEVEHRYAEMTKTGARHASQLGEPRIVVVIDELADLMAINKKTIEILIRRIAQKARAAGVHLVLATQRPSVNVVTGIIKANLPARLSFRLPSQVDSRTILDTMGAETLLGHGDGLFLAPGNPLSRVQTPFMTEDVIESITRPLRAISASWVRKKRGFFARLFERT